MTPCYDPPRKGMGVSSFAIKIVLLIASALAAMGVGVGLAVWQARKRPKAPRQPTETNAEAARRRAQERAAQPRQPQQATQAAPTRLTITPKAKQASEVEAELQALRSLAAKLSKGSTGDIPGDTSGGTRAKNDFNPSGQYNLPVRWRIEYVDQQGVLTWRTIRIEHLNLRKLSVEAFCETRQEHRTFFLRSMRKATDPVSGYEVDIDSYVRHVREKRSRNK